MKKIIKKIILVVICIVVMPLLAYAVVPATVNYQGYLTNPGGAPVNGTVSMTFRVYDTASGGTSLWEETLSVDVSNGVYSVVLGTTNPLDISWWTYPAAYLGVTVGTDAEMTPRQELTSVPYALSANDARWSEMAYDLNCTGCVSQSELNFTPGDITGVAPGTGLSGGGTTGDITLDVNTSLIQSRVSGACAVGSSIRVINQNGTVVCETDDNTTYTAGTGLTLNSTTFSVAVPLSLSGSGAGGIINGTNGNTTGFGVYGFNSASGNYGALGANLDGVLGSSPNGRGVEGYSANGTGVFGASASAAGYGVNGYAPASGGTAVYGVATGTSGRAVYGFASYVGATTNYGGYFVASGDSGIGVIGSASSSGGSGVIGSGKYGVYGSGATYGVYGSGTYGVYGSSLDYGVYGKKDQGIGEPDLFGYLGGGNYGVYGHSSTSLSGNYAVYGENTTQGHYGYFGGVTYGAYGSGLQGVGGYGTTYDFVAAGPGVNYGSVSSIRWKKNIREIGGALDKVLSLRGVYFDWDEEHGGQHDMGFIAEEVGEVIPEIVAYEPDGVYATGVDYGAMTPVLVQAIKEQQKIIESQQNQIDELKGEIEELKKKL